MIQKSMILCASLLALLLCVSASASEPAPEATKTSALERGPFVHISGCLCHASGEVRCWASASGGTAPYNYLWMHSGSGNPYQNNTPTVTITGCFSGGFSLTAQVRDSQGKIGTSAPEWHDCEDGGFGS
ncbi:MAG: hypothetical protein K0U98_25290 [Deltaproteobacteria bacterium]|nr:hypothetical protein [Deltaproteobacteria bacterium]